MLRFLERENGTGSLPETTAGRRSLTERVVFTWNKILIELFVWTKWRRNLALGSVAWTSCPSRPRRNGTWWGTFLDGIDDYDDQDGDDLGLDHSGDVEVGSNLITTMWKTP